MESRDAWAQRLANTLRAIEADYIQIRQQERQPQREHDPDLLGMLSTKAAGLSLLHLVSAIRTLPAFVGDAGLAPLHDLISALADLEDGKKPALLAPFKKRSANGVGKGNAQDAYGRRLLKRHAAVAVDIMERVGKTNDAARTIVAREFSAAGVKGRKGDPISAKSLFEWCLSSRSDPLDRQIIDATVAAVYAQPGWIPTEAAAIEWIRWFLRQPMSQSKI